MLEFHDQDRRNNRALIGGVVGGVIGFILLLAIAISLFSLHRRNKEETLVRGVPHPEFDMMSNGSGHPSSQTEILRSYNAEPFVAPTTYGSVYSPHDDTGNPELQRVLTPLRRGARSSHQWSGRGPASNGSGTIYSTSSSSVGPQTIQHRDLGNTSPTNGVLVTKTTTINLPPRYDTLAGAAQAGVQNEKGAAREGRS
jgi:hypothetical protein